MAVPDQRITLESALLVDPNPETISVFLPGQPPLVLGGSEEIDLTDIVPDLRLSVRQIFDALMM